MKYYKDDKGCVFAYSNDGSQDNYIGEKVLMTANEVSDRFKLTEVQILQDERYTALQYLRSTDLYMTVDKYETLTTERRSELLTSRKEARCLINKLDLEINKLGTRSSEHIGG